MKAAAPAAIGRIPAVLPPERADMTKARHTGLCGRKKKPSRGARREGFGIHFFRAGPVLERTISSAGISR